MLALAAWGWPRLQRVLIVGAAYKAKVLTSLIFGSGRTIDADRVDDIHADSYWPMRLFQTRVDEQTRTVTVSMFGLGPRTAVYRDVSGATLLAPGTRNPAPGTRNPALGTQAVPFPRSTGGAALDAVVAAAFAEPNPDRLRRTRAVIVVRDGEIIAERYAPGFSETTRFQGWSVTKSVTSALVGILVGQGRLALTDRALRPEWQPPDPRAAITLEDLLRMRSGLAFAEVYEDLSSDVVEMLFHQPDAAAYAASRPLVSPPGTTWSYASGTTNIVSSLVRRVVGESAYPDFPRRALFDPLGMSGAVMEMDAGGNFVGSSFMLATAREWARFGQLYLQDGVWDGRRILPEGWVRFSTTPTPQSPDGMYGAHWWLRLKPELGGATAAASRIPADAFHAVGHEAQMTTVIPSRRLVVVRLGLAVHIDAWNHAAFIADVLGAA